MPPAGERELYLYYRVDAEHCDEIVAAVRSLQESLRVDVPGLLARVLVAADRTTLMETYSRPGGGVDESLQAEIERRAASLAERIDGRRHLEVFFSA